MGHGIALEFALRGHSVALWDADPVALQRGLEALTVGARAMADLGLASVDDAEQTRGRVRLATALGDATEGANIVVEAVSEDLGLKQRIFTELGGAAAPDTVLASNTSTFMPSSLAAVTPLPQRVLVTHYFNPPHLLPVVEVVPHPGTDPDVVAQVRDLYLALGKQPVVLRKEVLGFVANRLQQALLREAANLLEQGVADAAEIDAIVRGSFGRRLAVAGPFEISDLAGLDVIDAIASQLWQDLATSGDVAVALHSAAAAGDYGAKTGRGFGDWDAASTAMAKQRIAKTLSVLATL
jgi:3-hydroxybutyryl-CoA dehydrogenase